MAELRRCAVVEAAVLGSPVPNKPFMVSVGVKQHQKKKERKKVVESPLSADVLCDWNRVPQPAVDEELRAQTEE